MAEMAACHTPYPTAITTPQGIMTLVAISHPPPNAPINAMTLLLGTNPSTLATNRTPLIWTSARSNRKSLITDQSRQHLPCTRTSLLTNRESISTRPAQCWVATLSRSSAGVRKMERTIGLLQTLGTRTGVTKDTSRFCVVQMNAALKMASARACHSSNRHRHIFFFS